VPFTSQIVQVYTNAIVEPENPGGYACYGWAIYEGVKRAAVGKGLIGKGPRMDIHLAAYEAIIAALEALNEMVYYGLEIVIYCQSSSALTRLQRDSSETGLPARLAPLYGRARQLMHKLGGNVRILPIPPEENTEARKLSWEACRDAQVADGKTPALHSRWVLMDLAHAAAEEAFGTDDARRRAWQQAVTGKASCKDMTAEELQRLVDSYVDRPQ
jgi:hypothetical protein